MSFWCSRKVNYEITITHDSMEEFIEYYSNQSESKCYKEFTAMLQTAMHLLNYDRQDISAATSFGYNSIYDWETARSLPRRRSNCIHVRNVVLQEMNIHLGNEKHPPKPKSAKGIIKEADLQTLKYFKEETTNYLKRFEDGPATKSHFIVMLAGAKSLKLLDLTSVLGVDPVTIQYWIEGKERLSDRKVRERQKKIIIKAVHGVASDIKIRIIELEGGADEPKISTDDDDDDIFDLDDDDDDIFDLTEDQTPDEPLYKVGNILGFKPWEDVRDQIDWPKELYEGSLGKPMKITEDLGDMGNGSVFKVVALNGSDTLNLSESFLNIIVATIELVYHQDQTEGSIKVEDQIDFNHVHWVGGDEVLEFRPWEEIKEIITNFDDHEQGYYEDIFSAVPMQVEARIGNRIKFNFFNYVDYESDFSHTKTLAINEKTLNKIVKSAKFIDDRYRPVDRSQLAPTDQQGQLRVALEHGAFCRATRYLEGQPRRVNEVVNSLNRLYGDLDSRMGGAHQVLIDYIVDSLTGR